MTRKDFIQVAAVLHDARQAVAGSSSKERDLFVIRHIEDMLCASFKSDNPLFDRQRFLLASGGRKEA